MNKFLCFVFLSLAAFCIWAAHAHADVVLAKCEEFSCSSGVAVIMGDGRTICVTNGPGGGKLCNIKVISTCYTTPWNVKCTATVYPGGGGCITEIPDCIN